MIRAPSFAFAVSLATAAAAAGLACSILDDPAAAPASLTECVKSGLDLGGNDWCSTCVLANCAGYASDFQNGCSAYLACVCPPGGAVESTAQTMCSKNLVPEGCAKTILPLETCEQASCGSLCSVANLDAGRVVSGASEAGPATFSCSNGTGEAIECDQQVVSIAELDAAQQGCLQVGGTPGRGCSDAGIAGCCRLVTGENCYYGDAGDEARQMACGTLGGAWSAGP